ncbi:ABC transporter ATP-binding protein [Sulfurospirillum sp. 1612]|uniref:ABC transporter ATP-binding protein n=1 Tax=Sulfurospirillum sp. 1612 TaxID=3094835 RepID=UPI002F946791
MIEFKNVSKVFEVGNKNRVTALHDVNFSINKGEIVLLEGPSGSGKSTILSLLAALSKPSSGEIIVAQKRISKLSDDFTAIFRRENIGFIFQKFNLIPTLSAKENAMVPLIPSNPDVKQLEAHIHTLFEKFSILPKLNIMAKNLSGGEQQRVAISRALINNPSIIIADEPTANLDKSLSLEFIEIVKKLKDGHNTIIIASHDPLFFDLDFIDRRIYIKNGEIDSCS